MTEKLGDYLTIKEAAQFLAVSPNTLRNWGKTGKIEMLRHPINGYRLFRREDLQQLLDDTAKKTSTPRMKPR